ncbi:cyclic nucleotide-binding protein [Candidatus Scalindua japonica]|uniref:Cyclic nucleotide-binding protein n=2 Tax=Candidatus Scalindua japonica TaxID=1284222 RepID=A0A286TTB5_9BACT|nr:cyclic nucleotide-binding protein [Candidatus Scalindua japonica]
MISGDPDKEYYENTKEIFGDDILITVSIASDNIFQEQILQSIENISDNISNITLDINENNVEVVTRVISLSTVTNIIERDGYLDTSKLIEYIPSELSELEEVKKNALQNETFLNDIISRDGKTAAVNAYIQAGPQGYITYNHEITTRIQDIIDIESERLQELGIDAEIFQIGIPFIKVNITKFLKGDISKLLPICLFVSLIIFWFSFRSIIAVIVPVITGIISIIWTLGFMAFMGYPINVVSNIIPLLLIVVGCTEDIHMLSEYSYQLKSGNEKSKAIINMAMKCGLAIFLTSLTTILGFTALTINKITMLKDFGICTTVGLTCNFVVTILFIPSFLQWTKVPKSFIEKQRKGRSLSLEPLARSLCRVAISKRIYMIIGTIVVMILAVIGTLKVKTDADYVNFFKKESEIRVRLDKLHSQIAGGKSFLIVIDTGQEDGIKNPKIMNAIANLQDFLNQRFDKTISVADYIKIMHREMNEGSKEYFKIPDSKDLISQYLLMIGGDDLERVLESTYSQACIVVRHNVTGSWEVNKHLTAIEEMSRKLFPKYVQVKMTGTNILDNKAADYMSEGQAISLGMAVVFVFIIISFVFLSPIVGLLALIPNMIPILLNFGIMGWFGIPLNPSTSIIAVIALGIAIDDTIHLMVRFHKDLKSTNDQKKAMMHTIRNEILPVMSTSIALALGFSIMISSNFVPSIFFGLLTAIVMLIALVSDLFVTPALLLSTQLVSSWDILKIKINEELTRVSPLLQGLKPFEIKKVALLGVITEYKNNEYIIRKGEHSKEMYLILDGNIEVTIRDKDKLIKSLQRGDIFGEMAYATGEARTADVIAKGPVEVLKINDKSLNNVKLRYPKIAARIFYNISRILSQRLKDTTKEWAVK